MPPQSPADRSTGTPTPETRGVDPLSASPRPPHGMDGETGRGSPAGRRDPASGDAAPGDAAVNRPGGRTERSGPLPDGPLPDGPPPDGPGRRSGAAAGGPPGGDPGDPRSRPARTVAAARAPRSLGTAGSAEWNLLTDEAEWSEELYAIFGRPPREGPLTLDELPSWVLGEDQPDLTAMVTGCLVDGRPIDGEFRIVRPDGRVRTVYMVGEPVLDAAGRTACLWAVLRDVSELRRGRRTLPEPGDAAPCEEEPAGAERRAPVGPRHTALPSWCGSPRSSDGGAHGTPRYGGTGGGTGTAAAGAD